MTIVELMVTVLVAAILAAIGLPALRSLVLDNQLRTAAADLATVVTLTRSEAIKRKRVAVLCSRETGLAKTCRGNTDWSQGWLAFVDDNADGSYSEDELLVARGPLPSGLVVQTTAVQVPFSAQGGAGATASFTFCDNRTGAHGRSVQIDATGRPSTAVASCPAA